MLYMFCVCESKQFIKGPYTDAQVLEQIQHFVDFWAFTTLMTSAESYPGKWVQVQSLALSEANNYIGKLQFDSHQHYIVNKDVFAGREHDVRISTASLVNRAASAWSHRPDDKYIAPDFGKLAPKTRLVTLYLKCCSNTDGFSTHIVITPCTIVKMY